MSRMKCHSKHFNLLTEIAWNININIDRSLKLSYLPCPKFIKPILHKYV